MKHILFAFCVALGLALPAAACDLSLGQNRSSVATYVDAGLDCLAAPPERFRFDLAMERAFVDKINQARLAEGLSPLTVRDELRPAARFHSLDMGVNGFFEHESPDGRKAKDRIAAFDRRLLAQSTAENLAIFGPATCYDQFDRVVTCFDIPGFKLPAPTDVVDELHMQLMESPGHRGNILAETSTHVSVGVARTDTGFYVTQLFANPVGILKTDLPTQIDVSSRLSIDPDLQGWGLGAAILIDADGQEHEMNGTSLRDVPAGDFALIVRGENERRERRDGTRVTITEWLDLDGPALTLTSSRGS